MSPTQVQFQLPTNNTDGSPIAGPISAVVLIDTVNPPIKSFAVPQANIAAAVAGLVTVTFAQLGFTPVAGTDYFADAEATDALGTSLPSAVVAFAYAVAPNAPAGFKVS